VATGTGLKDPATTLKVIAEPPVISPLLSEVERVMDSNFLSLRAGSVGDREKLIFKVVPSLKEVKNSISKEFNLDLDPVSLKIIRNVIAKFIKVKGKKIDVDKVIESLEKKNFNDLEIKPFFRLHPPRGGIDSKNHFGTSRKAVLGDNKNAINDILRRML